VSAQVRLGVIGCLNLASFRFDPGPVPGISRTAAFGVGFGGGVSFPAGANAIFVQGRYTLGLADINNDPEGPETKIKTSSIQIMARIIFPKTGVFRCEAKTVSLWHRTAWLLSSCSARK
jgi:hypothetical protein